MAVPTILATEATPLDSSKKRKLQDAIDLSGEGAATHTQIVVDNELAPGHDADEENAHSHDHDHDGHGHEHDHENCDHDHGDEQHEDDDDDDDSEIMENIMDQVEADPFVPNPDGTDGVTREAIDRCHARLREVGLERFFQESFSADPASARRLGPYFGLDPALEIDDGFYLRVLGAAIVRAYHKRQKLAQYNTLADAAALLDKSSNILVITGAGVSTSLGIPDFRSKGTGFYDKVRQLGFDEPEDVFDIEYFDEKPEIFYSLAGDILPDLQRFSPTHAFIRLLQDKGRLQTNYTQNIDNLEAAAGIDESRIIQCHGSFASATCRVCRYKVKGSEIYPDIRAKRVPRCPQCAERLAATAVAEATEQKPKKRAKVRDSWGGQDAGADDDEDEDDNIPEPGVMKPDITFFGEQLPNTFFDRLTNQDAAHTDLVIVIGTSLKVAPVSEMPNYIPHTVPHIYISLEPIRHVNFDIQLLGTCDDVVVELCHRAGWELKHEMIPEDFEAEVSPVPEQGHHWTIRRKGAVAADAAESAVGGSGDAEVAADIATAVVPEADAVKAK